MGRSPCCEKVGLNSGRWTAEEDELLVKYIQSNGEGSWKHVPINAGLLRCGKSCRMRWINYLRGNLKRGNMSVEEDEMIVMLHKAFGNSWSMIASYLPGRTDNEIKNRWHSCLRRQSYRFFTNKNKTKTSIDIANFVDEQKKRVGRVSRRVAKKYNNYKFFKNNKTPCLSNNKISSPPMMIDKQVDENTKDYSNGVIIYMNESQVDNGIGDKLEEKNRLVFQDEELLNIDKFLQGESMDLSAVLNLPEEDQLEQWLAEIEVENLEKKERSADETEDGSLSLNSLKTMGVCYDEAEWDLGFDFAGFNNFYEEDDMLVSLWEDGVSP